MHLLKTLSKTTLILWLSCFCEASSNSLSCSSPALCRRLESGKCEIKSGMTIEEIISHPFNPMAWYPEPTPSMPIEWEVNLGHGVAMPTDLRKKWEIWHNNVKGKTMLFTTQGNPYDDTGVNAYTQCKTVCTVCNSLRATKENVDKCKAICAPQEQIEKEKEKERGKERLAQVAANVPKKVPVPKHLKSEPGEIEPFNGDDMCSKMEEWIKILPSGYTNWISENPSDCLNFTLAGDGNDQGMEIVEWALEQVRSQGINPKRSATCIALALVDIMIRHNPDADTKERIKDEICEELEFITHSYQVINYSDEAKSRVFL